MGPEKAWDVPKRLEGMKVLPPPGMGRIETSAQLHIRAGIQQRHVVHSEHQTLVSYLPQRALTVHLCTPPPYTAFGFQAYPVFLTFLEWMVAFN